MHHKSSNNSPPTMDYSPLMLTTNTTSDTLTCLNVPRSTPIPPPSLSLLRTWSERVVGASLDVWSSFSLLHTWSDRVVGASLDVWSMFPTQIQINTVTRLVVDVDVCAPSFVPSITTTTNAGTVVGHFV
eukprot:scaffold255027_cov54-Attheya_sp.AAC.1